MTSDPKDKAFLKIATAWGRKEPFPFLGGPKDPLIGPLGPHEGERSRMMPTSGNPLGASVAKGRPLKSSPATGKTPLVKDEPICELLPAHVPLTSALSLPWLVRTSLARAPTLGLPWRPSSYIVF